jgi:hypothetical protein
MNMNWKQWFKLLINQNFIDTINIMKITSKSVKLLIKVCSKIKNDKENWKLYWVNKITNVRHLHKNWDLKEDNIIR